MELGRGDTLRAVLSLYDVDADESDRVVRCCLHDDTKPSMSVNWGEGLWFCFVCGVGGSAVQLIMHKDHCSFVQAREKMRSMNLRVHSSNKSEGFLGSTVRRKGRERKRTPYKPSWR